jgi:hypothetical protein
MGIKDFAINIRQNYTLKLPDCIIMATSLWLNRNNKFHNLSRSIGRVTQSYSQITTELKYK